MNREIFLVSCVSQKVGYSTQAKELYTSTWFLKARSYVERRKVPWFILSAEHGFVNPDSILAPYEKTLNTMGVRERRAWAASVIEQMELRLPSCATIVVLAGQRYREFLMDYLTRRAEHVRIPLEGLRIGEQLSWLGSQPLNHEPTR